LRVRRTTRLVAAAVAALAIVTGTAVAAAITAPDRAFLPADEIAIGTGLGRAWYLGGFSDLYPEGASGKEFWTLTDRGANLDGGVGGTPCATGTKVYAVPDFAPEIVRIGLKDDTIHVKQRIPLRFAAGPAVGFSVRPVPANELALDGSCQPLGTSPRGVDSEGIVKDLRDGSFWIADEYLPSILHVSGDGTVLTRIVPAGTEAHAAGSGATVVPAFPQTIGTNFRPNRGFEGIAISDDGETVYTALQSPMEYRPAGSAPPGPNPRNSLALRVFRLDVTNAATPTVTGQWAYPLDKGAGNSPLADKVSTLVWLGPDLVAVEERDDPAGDPLDNPQNTVNTRLYVTDLSAVAPIPPDSVWNGPTGAATGGKSLEQWYIPGQGTGAPAALPQTTPKCLWADVAKLLRDAGFTDPTNPARAGNGKIEGAAYVPARGANPALLAVLNDNDFGLFVPIAEQLDVVAAPPLCAAG
jgi:Esterase-like activity of phytase